jgi:uncharacterized protein YcfJ
MKNYLSLLFVVVLTAAGCQSMDSQTKTGAGIGALTGAVLGGVVGHNDDEHGVEGALIGGAAGAVAGGLIGNSMGDKTTTTTSNSYLTVEQIIAMSKNGSPDDLIIAEIKRTRSKYELTSSTITYLKNNNVSDGVIDYMMKTR